MDHDGPMNWCDFDRLIHPWCVEMCGTHVDTFMRNMWPFEFTMFFGKAIQGVCVWGSPHGRTILEVFHFFVSSGWIRFVWPTRLLPTMQSEIPRIWLRPLWSIGFADQKRAPVSLQLATIQHVAAGHGRTQSTIFYLSTHAGGDYWIRPFCWRRLHSWRIWFGLIQASQPHSTLHKQFSAAEYVVEKGPGLEESPTHERKRLVLCRSPEGHGKGTKQ